MRRREEGIQALERPQRTQAGGNGLLRETEQYMVNLPIITEVKGRMWEERFSGLCLALDFKILRT